MVGLKWKMQKISLFLIGVEWEYGETHQKKKKKKKKDFLFLLIGRMRGLKREVGWV